MNRVDLTLTPTEQAKLAEANRLLTDLTASHDACCECTLCEARWRTDCQDRPACWVVRDVVLAE